ncbi:hypothetical protein [Bradyrhizobium sp. CB3481]|uniref:hypothetical protein n=1 Tax=Bradyrhizobium sp. CB3481 TaxID=3039158 RepID=UPI0024B054FF|nr:hypothetical protein [Bradyrhizobium sp. CB3481]WFU16438.1 hypothetical protein QA643_36770 [Bradyrhizobium sp. CB3481]
MRYRVLSRTASWTRRLILAAATLSALSSRAISEEVKTTIPDDPISYDSLTLEIALTKKTLADERFLANDRSGAQKLYCEARKEVEHGLQLPATKNNTLELLRADIGYRLLLLNRNIDFWGAVDTLTPSMPGGHLVALEELLADFEKQSAEITAAAREVAAGAVETGKLDAMSRAIDGKIKSQTVNEERITIERRFQEDRQDMLDGRIDQLKANRKRLENEIASAVAQARAASAKLDKALTNAASSSLGIPPDVMQSIKDGKLDQAALSAVAQSDLLKSAAFNDALSQVTAGNEAIAGYVKQGQDLVRRGQELKGQLQTYRNEIEVAAQTFRKPTLEGLTRLGTQIYSKLDADTKREWAEKIRDAKPVVGAIQLIHSIDNSDIAGSLRQGAERYLASDSTLSNDFLRRAIRRQVESGTAEVGSVYSKLLGEVGKLKLDAANSERLADQAVRHWTTAFTDQLSPTAINVLTKAAGVEDKEALKERLSAAGLGLIKKRVAIHADRIEILDPAGVILARIQTTDLGALVQANPIEKFGVAAQEALEQELNRLKASEGALRQLVLKRLSPDVLDEAFRRAMNVPDGPSKAAKELELKDKAWNAVLKAMPNEAARNQLVERVAAIQIGSSYVAKHDDEKQIRAEQERRLYAGASKANEPSAGGDAQAEQMAKLALNAVLPGAGVAIDVISSFSAFGEAIDKAKRLAAELQANLSEELQVIELVNEARLKQVVLSKEREISQIMKAAAQAQYESYRFAITQLGANQDKERSFITIRRKLAFYLAERMRQEFDALDRSLALWVGRSNSPRGLISEMIKSDPQNVRLALDSEIHLFDWLNRERESTRTDVDGLMIHWRQLVRLSKDLCGRLGCTSGGRALGQVHQTDALKLTELLSAEDLRRWKRWQTSGSTEPLRLTVFLTPDGRFVPSDLENVRVIDVRIGSKWPSGKATLLTRVRLTHPGVGYVRSDSQLSRQVLLPISRWGHEPPEPFDIQELGKNWRYNSSARISEFEGYPIYTAWEILLEPVEENVRAEEVWLRFAYRYIDQSNSVGEKRFLDGPVSGPPGVFEPAIIWKNDPPWARVAVDGRMTSLALPKAGRVPVPLEALSLINVGRTQIPNDLCEPLVADEVKEVPGGSDKPAVFATCKSDDDMRRLLINYYRQTSGSEALAVASAEKRLKELKSNECKSPRPVSVLEAQR